MNIPFDSDLAELYGVKTETLNQSVKRNRGGVSQEILCSSLRIKRRGGRRYLPYVFTEQGVAMLSGVLHSKQAVQVNIAIMRAFVKLRQLLGTHRELAQKLEELEKKYNAQFKVVFDAIRQLMVAPEVAPKRRIGFHS